jgi:hypothetical protein
VKQYLTHLVACLKRSDKARPVSPGTRRVSFAMEALESRWTPSAFRGELLPRAPSSGVVQVSYSGDTSSDGIPDVIVGAGGANGHVKAF